MQWTARRLGDTDLWRVDAGESAVEVRVEPGQDLLRRLDVALRAALGVAEEPDPGRFRLEVREHAHGDLFELEQDTIWTVVEVATGRTVIELRGGTSHEFRAGTWSEAIGAHGVDDVALSADGRDVLVRDGGVVTIEPLPDP
jgi:hypothetical protein